MFLDKLFHDKIYTMLNCKANFTIHNKYASIYVKLTLQHLRGDPYKE